MRSARSHQISEAHNTACLGDAVKDTHPARGSGEQHAEVRDNEPAGLRREAPVRMMPADRSGSAPQPRALDAEGPEGGSPPDARPYGISALRGADGRQNGWRASIRRRGTTARRDFHAGRYGGLDQALKAALAFRDVVLREMAPMTRRERCAVLRCNNTSGIPGVYLRRTKRGEHWCAQLRGAAGEVRQRIFSVNHYGYERARELAVQARATFLAEIDGTVGSKLPPMDLQRPHTTHGDATDAPIALARPPVRQAPGHNPYAYQGSCHVVGVFRQSCSRVAGGRSFLHEYWVAQVMTHQRTLRRSFSIKVLGEEEARRQAIEQRLAWNREFGIPTRERAAARDATAASDDQRPR